MYKAIVKEAKDVNTGASMSFLSPRKQRPRKKTHELVEGEKHAVRAIIHELHIMKKRAPTIKGEMKATSIPLMCQVIHGLTEVTVGE
ncbi:hypothetical protein BDFB_013824 [Asbolus verrucosus]|uniref:Uncharacterized protein n=1 Tax=Asbolus verrucosus TaxID=1661398 RepID=A0A482VK39_ASBVE|nr:hypothetical protein BDFB_013824 [Asbolus verrucosus]